MAIVRGNVDGDAQVGANMSWNHDNVSLVKGILLVFTNRTYAGDITAVTYGGVAMAEEQFYASGSGEISLWYLIGPPAGINLVQLTHGAGQSIQGISVDYSGVDQNLPFGVILGLHATVNNSGPAALTEDLTTQDGWMGVDAAYNGNFNAAPANLAHGAGQTSLNRELAGGPPNNSGAIEVSEELATGPITTMSWTGMAGVDHWGHLAVPLRPAVDFETRPIEYTLDAWDPEQRIFDANGHVVPRYKIKVNVWARIVGLESTTAEVYESNYEDPTLVYFESVSYDGETDEVQIVTNRGDLPEVIMARLASGSTG
jgi:hypothetical protein